MWKAEIEKELKEHIIPFWLGMKDERGGFYGYLDTGLHLDKNAPKGCILNSRILWFFGNAYAYLKAPELLDGAKHAYVFLRDKMIDKEYGGLYWSLDYAGNPVDTTKHTYNQAFGIYALSSYYIASGDKEALSLAYKLYDLIESKCRDEEGYLEAFDRSFHPAGNEHLSENGVEAKRTMNTLLHVFEAYTELYRAEQRADVKEKLRWILDCFRTRMYNPDKKRQEVFFDLEYNSLIDLHSYGHDIETAWLLDRGIEVMGEESYREIFRPITQSLEENVLRLAFDGKALLNECEKGVNDTRRIWWVQAEAVVGFYNAYMKRQDAEQFKDAAVKIWEYIKEYVIDKREGSEWFSQVNDKDEPIKEYPIVEPWKCPYHNGRMCLEMCRRLNA